jgi:chromosome segregation ATPase
VSELLSIIFYFMSENHDKHINPIKSQDPNPKKRPLKNRIGRLFSSKANHGKPRQVSSGDEDKMRELREQSLVSEARAKEMQEKFVAESLAKTLLLRKTDGVDGDVIRMSLELEGERQELSGLRADLKKLLESLPDPSRKYDSSELELELDEEALEYNKSENAERRLRGEIAKLTVENETLNEANEKITAQIKELSGTGEELKEANGYMTAQIKELSDTYDLCLLRELDTNAGLRQNLYNEGAQAATQIRNLEDQLKTANKNTDSERTRADEAEKGRNDLNTRIGGKNTELETAEAKIAELGQQVKELNERIETLKDESELAGKRILELEAQADAKNAELREAETTIAGLKNSLKSAANSLSATSADKNGSEEAIREASECIQRLNEQLDEANRDKEKLGQQVVGLQNQIERLEADLLSANKNTDSDEKPEPEKPEKVELPKALRFAILDENNKVIEERTVSEDVIRIGTLNTSELCLKDYGISRMHAVIEAHRDSGKIQIIDLGSIDGTFVNGDKINTSFIKNGDTLTFGELTVKVYFENAASTGEKSEQKAPDSDSDSDERPESNEQPDEQAKSYEPKTVHTIHVSTTVPTGQHLTINTLKAVPGRTVSVEDGAKVTIEKAFAGAVINLLGSDAECEILGTIGDIQDNPIKIIPYNEAGEKR